MNIEKKIKEELLDAAANKTEGAEAFVLMIGYKNGSALSNMAGTGANILSLLLRSLDHALSSHPDELEKDLRIKIAKMILGGIDDDAE